LRPFLSSVFRSSADAAIASGRNVRQCRFDYRIHPGPARSRNAIRLMEFSGYPDTIIKEVEVIAEILTAHFQTGKC
jgi:DNA mismatch repair ATPase MutS